jgi:hypothetical protein
MTSPEKIVCKPTPWFTLRAVAMLAMFSVFAVLFFVDGTTGYREKNLEYYIHSSFEDATKAFSRMNSEGDLTPEEWQEFASGQVVDMPSDPSLLPVGTEMPLPWPAMLTDYKKVKPLQHNILWREYSAKNRMSEKVEEHPFDAGKIRIQIIAFYICLALSLGTLFFLIRTSRRFISADGEALTTAQGRRIPYSDMRTLDLRKWDTKGIALIEYEGSTGRGQARIDGLTYGGFKKEQEQPAEQLMERIRGNFSGEIVEYTTVTPEEAPEAPTEGV